MGNYSGKERHGSSAGTAVNPFETSPTSPYTLTSTTLSPTTQLVSVSNSPSKTVEKTATPQSPQETLSPSLISTNQNEMLRECRTGPTNHIPEEGHKVTQGNVQVPQSSGVCVKGDTGVDAKLIQDCLVTLGLNSIEESTHMLNDLLQCFLIEREKIKEELRTCKEKIQAERDEWQQFQADLKVALVVSDRLRAEAEEELSALRDARQDWDRQLADALQGRREVEGQLKNLKIELEQSTQKLKMITGSHQGAPNLRSLAREGGIERVEVFEKNIGPAEKWRDEIKGKKELCISGTTERSRSLCRLPSDYPDVVINGTPQVSVTVTKESPHQNKTQTSLSGSLDQQNNTKYSIKDNKAENSLLQMCNSSVLDVPNKINWTRTQEDFQSSRRLLRPHGGSKRNSLLRWCQGRTQGYKNIEITNFSSSWVDGLAFCAIYHSFLPSHIPYNTLSPENKKENLALAFQTGESFGISTSLTVEEMLKDDAPDWHRVLENKYSRTSEGCRRHSYTSSTALPPSIEDEPEMGHKVSCCCLSLLKRPVYVVLWVPQHKKTSFF
ncbi:cytospin-A-like isoform X2 [Myxocyprinus asiaticus]|uniref:cytospin-A-like isoform X2 n=1 Tax=Myxocyprinus asiaticus TaxID=70543 RepID=UPI0022235DAD|nr:cytospin-A-like isoform X2 [Myxocyprinus asiaticus]